MSGIGNKEIFAKNLNYYIEKSGKTKKELAEIFGVAPSTFNDWTKAKKYPRIDKIEIMANHFRILKSDLIEEKTEEHKKMQQKNNNLSDIVIKMRTDEEFYEAVNLLFSLDGEKLRTVKETLRFLQ